MSLESRTGISVAWTKRVFGKKREVWECWSHLTETQGSDRSLFLQGDPSTPVSRESWSDKHSLTSALGRLWAGGWGPSDGPATFPVLGSVFFTPAKTQVPYSVACAMNIGCYLHCLTCREGRTSGKTTEERGYLWASTGRRYRNSLGCPPLCNPPFLPELQASSITDLIFLFNLIHAFFSPLKNILKVNVIYYSK